MIEDPRSDIPRPAATRLVSIDVLRGLAIVLMAVDHVRVFSGLPAGGPTAGIFFTRWVTHFCAPAFFFLSGTSAFLRGRREETRGALARYLASRGALLVVLELTVMRFAWTFNFDWQHYLLAGVLWALGWSMIALAAIVRLPLAAIVTLGLLLVVGPELFDARFAELAQRAGASAWSWSWSLLYFGFRTGPVQLGEHGPALVVLFALVPWVGVMACGYAFGAVMTADAGRRRRVCLAIGSFAVVLFAVLRWFDAWGDPFSWRAAAAGTGGRAPRAELFAFLETNKYPASLDFLLMTLGPLIAAIPFVERMHGALARFLVVFGREPLLYYVLHVPLLHLLALGVSRIRLGAVDPWLFENHPMGNPPPPPESVWSLGWLWLTWAVSIPPLWFACRAFARAKWRRRAASA